MLASRTPVTSALAGFRSFGTASVRWQVVDGILHYRSSGVITESVLVQMQGHCAELSRQSRAVVADHLSSVFGLNSKMLAALGMVFDTFGPRIEVPLALVIKGERTSQFRTYAKESLHHGIVRAVFRDLESACAWAALQAENGMATG